MDDRPPVPAERFLVTIIEAAYRERGRPDPVWSTGDLDAGVPRDAGVDAMDIMPVERPHRYLVATTRGVHKAVAIAVEEFHRPARSGCPHRDILSVSVDTAPGAIDRHTLLDPYDQ